MKEVKERDEGLGIVLEVYDRQSLDLLYVVALREGEHGAKEVGGGGEDGERTGKRRGGRGGGGIDRGLPSSLSAF